MLDEMERRGSWSLDHSIQRYPYAYLHKALGKKHLNHLLDDWQQTTVVHSQPAFEHLVHAPDLHPFKLEPKYTIT